MESNPPSSTDRHRILLGGVARALGHLLRDNLAEAIPEAFREAGEATDVDRVYFFEVEEEEQDGELIMSQRYEWARDTVSAEIDNPDLQGIPFRETVPRWHRLLTQKHPVSGLVRTFPEEERALLDPQGILSLLVLPVHLEGTLRGFVGFDDCRNERVWDETELTTLAAVASSLGEAILRLRDRRAHAEMQVRYRQVVEGVRDVVFQTDAQGNWILLNPAWERLTGFAVGETLGRSVLDFVWEDDRDLVSQTFAQLRADSAESQLQEIRIRTRAGGFRWADVLIHVRREGGAFEGLNGTLHDVTERREAHRVLTEALQRERELGELKSRFVAMASHELRTPLTTIKSSAELLSQFGEQWTAERRAKLFDRIFSNVDHMGELIADVLMLGRAGSDQMPFSPLPLDLSQTVRELARGIHRAEAPTRTLETDLPEAPLEAFADPKLLQLLLRNLLSNAFKYAPSGPVRLRLACQGDAVVLSVADQGIGIDEADRTRVFEPFGRAQRAEAFPGTGLGLPIALRVAELHGGTLGFDSTPDVGTTFHARFPLRPS
jgi:PAS domain S-box-containing protein